MTLNIKTLKKITILKIIMIGIDRRKYTQIKEHKVQEQLKSRNTKANANEEAVTKEAQQCSA